MLTATVQHKDKWIDLGDHNSLWDAIATCQTWIAKQSEGPLTYLISQAKKSAGKPAQRNVVLTNDQQSFAC